MERKFAEIAHNLAEIEKSRKIIADGLNILNKNKTINLKSEIKSCKLNNIKICGVDGGLLKKEYHGAGIIIRRAVAVCFEYKSGKLENTGYFPNKIPAPDAVVTGPELSDNEFNIFANLKREEIELRTAIESIEKFSPNVLIRDGSIVLHPSSMPAENSESYKTYEEVISLYKKLYALCSEKNILLCGAVEDSRGRRYCDLLLKEIIPNMPTGVSAEILSEKNVLRNTTDTLFLYYLLAISERTVPIDYSQSSELPILKDLDAYARKLFAIYIKAAEFDRPLRIDFFSEPEKLNETAEKVAAIIYEISKGNRTYSYPSVLIEADGRAKLSEIELDRFKSALAGKLGRNPALFELRREMRPF